MQFKFNHLLSDNLSCLFKPWNIGEASKTINVLKLDIDKLNREFCAALASVKLCIIDGRIFHILPGATYTIHIDYRTAEPNTFSKINYVIGGTGSYMNWFRVKDGRSHYTYVDKNNDKVHGFKAEDCEEIYRAHIPEEKCTLLDVGTPHSLTNLNEIRTSYSMWLGDYDSKKRVTFEDAKRRLQKYIID